MKSSVGATWGSGCSFLMKILIKYLTGLQISRYGRLRSIDSDIDVKYVAAASKLITFFSIFPWLNLVRFPSEGKKNYARAGLLNKNPAILRLTNKQALHFWQSQIPYGRQYVTFMSSQRANTLLKTGHYLSSQSNILCRFFFFFFSFENNLSQTKINQCIFREHMLGDLDKLQSLDLH